MNFFRVSMASDSFRTRERKKRLKLLHQHIYERCILISFNFSQLKAHTIHMSFVWMLQSYVCSQYDFYHNLYSMYSLVSNNEKNLRARVVLESTL